jgi:4-alpha-glucanotransferase
MHELTTLRVLARAMGVHTHYTDGLGRSVTVGPETLVSVCASLGAAVKGPGDAASALHTFEAEMGAEVVPVVIVAWDGALRPVSVSVAGEIDARLQLEGGEEYPLDIDARRGVSVITAAGALPFGYHRLRLEAAGSTHRSTVISAPMKSWRRAGAHRTWGVSAQLAALRSSRSRAFGDLNDLETTCRWIGERGGDLVMLLPLLPTFNSGRPEPSPYSPVSRLFWSELILDIGDAHRPAPRRATLDVASADAEVRAALAGNPAPPSQSVDDELITYAKFRGAQARLGRNWREWPADARSGRLEPDHVDREEERYHLVAQVMARRQLGQLHRKLEREGIRLGLDLPVGVHPDGYDPWSRQLMFGEGMSVGAPPDAGFPSGQDWGFQPLLPQASRREGHRYVAASIAHQAALSGVLRVDHIMAWTRLYWIPRGLGKDQGTYVSYPDDELFAVLTLESTRNRCEVVGENLGTVPPHIGEALSRHRIWGMFLAQVSASECSGLEAATEEDVAFIGTHDTPTFAGWLAGVDIEERVRCHLLDEAEVSDVWKERANATNRLARRLKGSVDDPRDLLEKLLEWLGGSDSFLVIPWLEDLWLEEQGVNLPGTRSSDRANWSRPMSRLLDDALADPSVQQLAGRIAEARAAPVFARHAAVDEPGNSERCGHTDAGAPDSVMDGRTGESSIRRIADDPDAR